MARFNVCVKHKNEIFNFSMEEVNADVVSEKAVTIETKTHDGELAVNRISVTAKLTAPTSGRVELTIQAYESKPQRGGYKWLKQKDTEISGVFDIKDTMRFDYGEYQFVGRRVNY